MTIDLVVLDIAGTAVEEHNAVYDALREAVVEAGGHPAAEDIQRWMGAGKHEAITALLDGTGASAADVDAAFADFRQRLADTYAATPPQAMPGVTEAIGILRGRGVKVALTTGFDRAVTEDLLQVIGWDKDVLDAVVCIDDVRAGRPAPYMVFRAMEETDVRDVARVLTAGDTLRDLEAGTAAGAALVVGVLSGGQDEQTLSTGPHTHLLPSAADIPALLDSLR